MSAPDTVAIKPPSVTSKPRLRFDRVVLELIARLQAGCTPVIPDDRTVVVTCTAPIRLSGKTALETEQRIRAALARDARKDIVETLHDNTVRIRLVRSHIKDAARLAAFVHNPDPGVAEGLLDMTQAMIDALAPAYARRRPGKRPLVVANPSEPLGKTWRHIYAALAPPPRYETVLMTFADGTVQTLRGEDHA
jgi:hypothetical protein